MPTDIVITYALTSGADILKLNPALPVAPAEIARGGLETAAIELFALDDEQSQSAA